MRLAYVVGGSVDPKLAYLIDAHQSPRFEYNVFLSRNEADTITMDDLERGRSLWTKWWRRVDKPFFALSALTHERVLKYDAVITSGEDVGIPIGIGAMMDALTVPIYIITHGSFFGSPKFRAVCRLFRRMPNIHFLCLSESLRQRLIALGIPQDRAHNAGYGVDTDFFAPRSSTEAPVIVSAGTAARDYVTLVEASRDLGIDVKIAASSRWHTLSTEIDGNELPKHVEARSYGNYMGLRDLYARAAFVVVPLFPAVHACGYAVIAEAMAMGKAVIVSRTDSPSDFVVDGETGFYVAPGNVTELRDKMQTLLESPDRAAAMGAAARSRMQEHFSVEAYSGRIETIVLG